MLLSMYISALATRIRTPLAACLLALIFFQQPALAQSDAPRVTPETIVRYLSQDLFLSPGVGFKRVRIGLPFVKVAQVWGVPNKGFESSETGNQVIWLYLARDSSISLTGGSNVKTIRIEGSLTSPFSSSEGAHFGMTPHQVISIYGPPEENVNLTRLSYPSRGIEFAFEHGGLKWMRVFSPKS